MKCCRIRSLVGAVVLSILFAPALKAQMPLELVSNPSVEVEANSKPLLQSSNFRGTVLLCGGGSLPRYIREVFHKIGKGEEGSLVLIPSASPKSDEGNFDVYLDYWASFRWKSVKVIHSSAREDSFSRESIDMLRNATAVWISGGDQNRLVDRYVGTPIESELYDVLYRGGIVGGTSAGAAIASADMIAGGKEDPFYARGFRFFRSAIIDQHFSEKGRFQRLAKAIQVHPNHIGIGIDESTGLFIDKDNTRVVGNGRVFLYQTEKVIEMEPRKSELETGSTEPLKDPVEVDLSPFAVLSKSIIPGELIETASLKLFAE